MSYVTISLDQLLENHYKKEDTVNYIDSQIIT